MGPFIKLLGSILAQASVWIQVESIFFFLEVMEASPWRQPRERREERSRSPGRARERTELEAADRPRRGDARRARQRLAAEQVQPARPVQLPSREPHQEVAEEVQPARPMQLPSREPHQPLQPPTAAERQNQVGTTCADVRRKLPAGKRFAASIAAKYQCRLVEEEEQEQAGAIFLADTEEYEVHEQDLRVTSNTKVRERRI